MADNQTERDANLESDATSLALSDFRPPHGALTGKTA